jgi:hypothetical protein
VPHGRSISITPAGAANSADRQGSLGRSPFPPPGMLASSVGAPSGPRPTTPIGTRSATAALAKAAPNWPASASRFHLNSRLALMS